MPTTSAIAGTVSGMRQMNSTTRLILGSRSRTHTMVGSSSTSIMTDVMTASSREAMIASESSGVLAMSFQESSVRGAAMPLPRVDKHMDANIGIRHNNAAASKTP